ncbi:MAG: DUF3592 domain-containing protein [Phycisphaerae bacterium]
MGRLKAHVQNAGVGLFLIVPFVAITLISDAYLVQSALRATNAQFTYQLTSGVITQSGLSTKPVSNIDDRRLELTYRYSVNGEVHAGSRYAFDAFQTAGMRARRVAREHPVGRDVPVYYSAAQPSEAVLQVGLNSTHALLFIFLLPFNVVVVATLLGIRRVSARRAAAVLGGRVISDAPRALTYRIDCVGALTVGSWALFLTPIAMCGVLMLGFGGDPPAVVSVSAIIGVVAAFFGAMLWRTHQIAAGRFDIRVDFSAESVHLPRIPGNRAAKQISFDQICAVEVEVIDAESAKFRVRIVTRSDGAIVIHEYDSPTSATALADWLKAQVRRDVGSRNPHGLS